MILKKCNQAGFTLIEMIGVLAVIAILSAVIAPPVMQQITRAVNDAEAKNLSSLARSLEEYVRANKKIPTASSWATAVGSIAALPLNKITNNERGFTRGYYVDPHFFTVNNKVFPGYIQTTGLTNMPVSPRIMIVSSMVKNAPVAPTTSTAFNATWDQTAGKIITESANVKIQRVHLAYLFHHVFLTNQSPSLSPKYRLGNGALKSIPAGIPGTLSTYVMDGSQLSLFLDTGNLNYTLLVNRDETMMYGTDGSNWFWGRP